MPKRSKARIFFTRGGERVYKEIDLEVLERVMSKMREFTFFDRWYQERRKKLPYRGYVLEFSTVRAMDVPVIMEEGEIDINRLIEIFGHFNYAKAIIEDMDQLPPDHEFPIKENQED